jgi:DNA-binding NarL/FixJ family response regulator
VDDRQAVAFGGRRAGLRHVVENDDTGNRELHALYRSRSIAVPMQTHFSPRQSEIVGLIASGYSDKQIALLLKVSQRTVRTQLERLYAAHGMHSRAQAVHAWGRQDKSQGG